MAVKSDQTRQLLADVALRMFREVGFEKTTMRAIAGEAGVSVGNAYYYFSSKDDLVLELYEQVQADHTARASRAVEGVRGFGDRLTAVLHAGIDVMAPYHGFGGEFISTAIRPASPVNPFGKQAAAAREASLAVFSAVVQGSSPAVPEKFRADLPELLWLAYMGVTLFWVHDDSEDQQRTRRLIDGLAPLVARGISLARIPGVNKVFDDVLGLARSIRARTI
ncbi:TetR/AcrR family transcriptional regulator [Arthrobacter sp. 2RAF22]|uniref:TetR/AcrR family transcriptional regulator n=1 Tax=Arthrobacter sp. 2RAF22 TaxID=3232996 RepID=UPI003F93EDCD